MTRACRPLTAWRRLAAPLCAAAMLAVPRPAAADTCSGLGFGAPAFVTTGTGPSAVAVGDFDRDGKLDIATADQGANGISVLLGNGGGVFGLPASLASAASAADIVAGDLDRDGWLDLVVASGSSAQVVVHRGAVGGFGGGTPFPVLAVPSRVALADFDRDGNLDLVVVSTASHRILVFKGLGNLSFGTTPVADLSPTGSPGPEAAVPGDFTGDGRLDLAVAEYNAGRVDLFVGDGTGALTAGPSTSLGTGPRDLYAGDVDRDGKLDLVVAQATTSEVLVLLGQGDGTFQQATPVAVGAAPARVALGDLDRDGAGDLVVLDGTGRVVAFEGGGTAPAVFGAMPYVAVTVSGSLSGLALGDFTSDARPDVVTTRTATNEAVLVPDQSGSPCVRSSFAAAPRSYSVADGPVSAAAADFDRDGRVDLAVATTNDSYVRVRRSTGGDFVPLADFGPFSSPPRGLATADLDFDGQGDLVVALGDASSGRVQVIVHDSTGALTIGPSLLPAGLNTAAVAIGDFDGNGTPDVAAVSEGDGSVWVFLGDGTGAFTPLSGNPVLTGLTTPQALVAADLTGDGLADIAVAEWGATPGSPGAVHVLRAGVSGGALTFTRITPPAGLTVGAYPESIAAGDLDGDGQVDLVTADNGSSRVSVIRRDAGGGFLAAEPHTTGANPTAVALVDLTGDGRLDIAVTTSATRTLTALENLGGGTFASAGDYPVRGYPRFITPIDADGDGRLDLAVTCQTADAVVVLRTRPRVNGTDPVFDRAPNVAAGSHPRSAVLADLDGDGKLDLAVANQADSTVSILLNDGAGSFPLPRTVGVPAAGPESIVAGDFNRDGHVDLAVSAPLATPKGIMVLLGSATTPGDFTLQGTIGVGSPTSTPDALAVGDFDGDGILDLALCDKSLAGTVYVLHGDGSGGFSIAATITVGAQPTAIVAADFDRDGRLDLAVANEGANNIQVLRNTGTSFTVLTPPLTLPGTDVTPVSIAAADFDGDGDADLAVAASGGDRVHVYRNDNGTLTSLPVASLDAPYLLRAVTAADVNLDGRPDLLAIATGLTVFRGKGGTAFEAPETVVAGWLPQAVAVGELSGDGWPDVAVVNEDSGDVSLLISAPCQARRLEVTTHPAACESGLPPYAPAATVVAYDAGGNVASCAAGTVIPSIVPGTGAAGAVLGGTQASGLPLASGAASFTGLTLDRPGRRYQLQFSLGSLPPARTRSFTLGAALSILGTPSMCPGGSSTFSTEDSYDEYAWTLTPDVVPPAATHTPTVTLLNPPVTGAHTLGVSARVDGCFLQASQAVFGGPLQTTTLGIDGPATVCVDCIAGTIRPFDQGGGPARARQWEYRTVSGGDVTDMPGETGETYVLKGASFPGPGIYQVVVLTTPTCGTATLSQELQVEVLSTVPSEEVQHLAASSRGTTTTGGENLLQWVNVTSENEVRVLWNKAPTPLAQCLPPATADVPSDGQYVLAPPLPTVSSFLHTDDGTPPGLDFDTTYCYSVFVQTATGWSKGRTVRARPFDSDSGPVKWAYSTGATAVVPPVVGYDGILAMSNDRTVHSLTRGGANGGRWPSGWVPYPLTGVVQSRSPVVPFGATSPVFPDRSVLFAADDQGDVHAVDAATGQTAWAGPRALGTPIVGAPGGLFTQYHGVADLVIVGTRDTTGPNQLVALAAGTGAPAGTPYDAGGTIGPISGSPIIDYASQRVYFTSRSYNGGPTVWCVQVDGTTPFVPCSGWTDRSLGDVDGSPILRGGRLYFGNASGIVYSLDAASGLDERTFVTNDGAVKGFVFPDRRDEDLIFATNTEVWSIADTGAATMPVNWEWTDAGLNPSLILFWPQTSYVYVGSRNGRLYQLDFTNAAPATPPLSTFVTLGDGLAQVGAPSLDIGVAPPDVSPGKKLLVVGSESGTLYGVEVPF
jgi:hypothetical protein